MRTFFGLTTIGLVFAACCGAALAWDGSAYLYQLLDAQVPYVAHGRYISIPLHWPTLIVANFTNNVAVLQTIFGLVYAGVPLVALVLCWWIVGKRAPMLFVWPVLGIGLAMLPGQFFFVAEANIAIYLFWPILMVVLMHMQPSHIPVVIGLMIALFLTHPFAIVLLALASVVLMLMARRFLSEQRKLWIWALAFGVLALLNGLQLAFFSDSYESEQLTFYIMSYAFRSSVLGLPLLALAFTWLATLALTLPPLLARSEAFVRRASTAAVVCVATVGVVLVLWARDVSLWSRLLDFRYWAPFSSLPFFALAIFERMRYTPEELRNPSLWQQRTQSIQAVGVVSMLVLMVQGTAWFNLNNRLHDTIVQSPWTCLSTSSMPWVKNSPLGHWSVATDALLLQGAAPTKVVLDGDGCGETDSVNSVHLTSWLTPRWDDSWFNLQQLRANLLGELDYAQGCSYALTTGWYQTETSEQYWWRWSNGQDAQMRLLVDKNLQAGLSGQIETLRAPNQIDVLVNGTPQTTLQLNQTGLQTLGPIPVLLQSGKNVIQFKSRNEPAEDQGRSLAMSVANLVVGSSDASTVCRFHP